MAALDGARVVTNTRAGGEYTFTLEDQFTTRRNFLQRNGGWRYGLNFSCRQSEVWRRVEERALSECLEAVQQPIKRAHAFGRALGRTCELTRRVFAGNSF